MMLENSYPFDLKMVLLKTLVIYVSSYIEEKAICTYSGAFLTSYAI